MGDTEEDRSSEEREDEAGWWGRAKAGAARVSVEPVLFVHNLCTQLVWVASQDLMVEKACTANLGYDEEVCGDLAHHDAAESAAQDLVSQFLMYRTIFETSIKVVWVIMLGSWSDRCGRWVPLVLSLAGLMMEALLFYLSSLAPSMQVQTLLVCSVPYALSGGTHALLMLCFSYLADKSKLRRRTVRMGLLDAAYYLGSPVGSALVGPVLDYGGYAAAFCLPVALYALTIAYVTVRIRQPEDTQDCCGRGGCGGCGNCCGRDGWLDVAQLYEAVQVTVKPRPHRASAHVLLLILAMLCDSLPVSGEGNVKYLFVQRALDWDHTNYSHWATFASLLSVCVMVSVMPLLSVVMGLSDGWLGVVGGVSRTASNLLYGLVTTPASAWLMWAGAVVASGKNMAPVAIRSLLSQLVAPNEIGQVYAVMAVCESLVGLAAAPLYNAVYTATLDTRPSTYNFLSAAFNLALTLLLVGVTLSLKRVAAKKTTED